MDTNSIITLAVLFLIVIGVIFRVAFWPGIRSKSIKNQPFPKPWLEILNRRLPFFEKLPSPVQRHLQILIKIFIEDKSFVGCAGLEIDDEIRITIAAQACLLLLNRKDDPYSQLQSILVYPTTFIATRQIKDELGLVSTNHVALLGESWSQGKVILAWDNVEFGVCNLEDGRNVVLHEFAHQLDNETGTHNGAPLLRTRGAYRSWAQIFSEEFESLQAKAYDGKDSLIDKYGATNPAEFFAVCTETFFEKPTELRRNHPELFEELEKFYGVNPETWQE